MSNEQQNSRTVIEDLPVAEQELTADEMGKVQGGDTIKAPPPPPPPPDPLARQTPKRDFGD